MRYTTDNDDRIIIGNFHEFQRRLKVGHSIECINSRRPLAVTITLTVTFDL